jgi:hypothetical protein
MRRKYRKPRNATTLKLPLSNLIWKPSKLPGTPWEVVLKEAMGKKQWRKNGNSSLAALS